MEKNKSNKKPSIPAGNNAVAIKPKWQHIVLIIILGFVVYSNSLNSPFIYDGKIVENDLSIRDVNNIPGFFRSSYWKAGGEKGISQKLWRPLTMSSYALDYVIWGLNPTGYHLTNIVLHILNCLLVYYLSMVLLKKTDLREFEVVRTAALLISLLFAIHPIHTEVVTGISGRSDLMYVFFYFLAFFSYITCMDGVKHYLFSLTAFILALLSKEMALTLPGVILLYDFIFVIKEKHDFYKKLKTYLGYVMVVIIYFFFRSIILGSFVPGNAVSVFHNNGFMTRMLTMSKVFIHYIRTLFYPVRLTAIYNRHLFYTYRIEAVSTICIIFIILSLTLAFYRIRRNKIVSYSILWFFITLIPVSNIIPIGELIAERFLYLSSVGFFTIIVWLILKNTKKFIVYSVIILMLSLYWISTVYRNSKWKDGVTFWSDALEKYPDSAKVLYNRASVYGKKGLYKKAIADFDRVLEISPAYENAYRNRGIAYERIGDIDKAISDYTRQIESDSVSVDAYIDRGVAYGMKKLYDKAIADFTRAIELNPEYWQAYINRGITYKIKGEYFLAKQDEEKARAIQRKLRSRKEPHQRRSPSAL